MLRLRAAALVLILGLEPTAAAASPCQCAVLLAATPAGAATGEISARRELLVAALPEPPRAHAAAFDLPSTSHSSLANRANLANGANLTNLGKANVDRERLARWVVLEFADPAQCERGLAYLRTSPLVETAEPVFAMPLAEVRPASRSHDAPAGEVPWNVERVRAPEALQLVEPDTTIIVAVIDTGADLTHPDLQQSLWRNDDATGNAIFDDDLVDQNGDGIVEDWERHDDDDNGYVDDTFGFDFTDAPGQAVSGDALERDNDPSDENGHGTHVAGIIAARGSLQGVAPFVDVMVLRAAFSTPFGGGLLETDDAAAAIVYAVDNGARILNLSWGDREESRLVREAITYASARGVLVVAAAGNGATDAPHYPSGDARVLGVAAHDRSGRPSTFSNFGSGVAIAAPGEEFAFPGAGIISLEPLDLEPEGRGARRGTSMAAPHVVGVAAIVMSRADRPDAARTRSLLLAAAARRDGLAWDARFGHGFVDAAAAVRLEEDLVLAITATQALFRRGELRLSGTVLGGDLQRWRLRASGAGRVVDLTGWQTGQRFAEPLVETRFDEPDGDWEYVLEAETSRLRRERHGFFRVDHTAPEPDSISAQAAWRGAEPHWTLRALFDEPVQLHVEHVEGQDGAALFASAGFAARLDLAVRAEQGSSLRLRAENEAGLARECVIAAPPVLPAWPEGANLSLLATAPSFRPESAWGRTPAGECVVWGRAPGSAGTLQAWSWDGSAFLQRYEDASRRARPVAYADANGDARADLLLQSGGEAEWLLTSAGGWPDSLAVRARAERVLGFFQLDDDAPAEALLSSADSLFVYDDVQRLPPRRLQVLLNPQQSGFTFLAASAAVGDVDGDARLEIVIGDAEGYVHIFERSPSGVFALEQTIDTGGTYAYEVTALPEPGFIVGRQRTQNVTGDGFERALYEFLHYAPTAGGFSLVSAYPIVVVENALGAACTSTRSPASGEPLVFLVHEADVYLLRGDSAAREQYSYVRGADGEAPVVADLDDDGRVEVVLCTPAGATVYGLDETRRGPHSLRTASLGENAVRLAWASGDGESSQVRREQGGVWQILGETTASDWIDSTLVPRTTYTYEIAAVSGGQPRGTTSRVVGRANARPRLIEARRLGSGSFQLWFTNPIAAESAVIANIRLRDPDGNAVRVLQVTQRSGGNVLDVVLEGELECGESAVTVSGVRDVWGGALDPPEASLALVEACAAPPFAVRRVQRTERRLVVEFSRPPAAEAEDVSRYTLTWNGRAVPLVSAERLDATHVQLVAGEELRGRGIPYELQLDAELRAAGDGAGLESAGLRYQIHVDGLGSQALFVYPNPVQGTAADVVFAEAAPDTRIRIYNLEGELVRELDVAQSGGVRWDLRTQNGARVPSGAYLFVARDSRGMQHGRIVIMR